MPGTDEQADERSLELCQSLVEKLVEAQRCLQKCHVAIQKASGSPASNPLRGQGRVLCLLADGREMRQRDMCSALDIRPQSLGETLTKLEKAGLVERRSPGPANHSPMMRITSRGLERIQHHAYLARFESFSDDELIQFMEYLDRVIAELDTQRERLIASQSSQEDN